MSSCWASAEPLGLGAAPAAPAPVAGFCFAASSAGVKVLATVNRSVTSRAAYAVIAGSPAEDLPNPRNPVSIAPFGSRNWPSGSEDPAVLAPPSSGGRVPPTEIAFRGPGLASGSGSSQRPSQPRPDGSAGEAGWQMAL